MTFMKTDPYEILGLSPTANTAEIKSAYRKLVKKHHPDKGGDPNNIIKINAAWELLRDPENRLAYNQTKRQQVSVREEANKRGVRNASASHAAKVAKVQAAAEDHSLLHWFETVYSPIDRLLGQIINPFSSQLRELSADPYDDSLMEAFCLYLAQSQKRLEKIELIYRSMTTPTSIRGFGLSLYHCLSQVKDAFNELERYTMGYVDSYLHDGREMLREAKKRRERLKDERRRLQTS